MEQIIRIKCWKCGEMFTMRAEVADVPSPNFVETVLPCPYCDTANQVTIREDQVKTTTLYRKPDDAGNAEPASAGPLPDNVYEGAPPPDE